MTLLGCSFRCIYGNDYRLSQYPDSSWMYRGFVKPEDLIIESLDAFQTSLAWKIGVKRLSFTEGEPSIHTPYLEEVIGLIKGYILKLGVGLATNGFCTLGTMKRLEKLATYINFEIKAFDSTLHQAITVAPSQSLLENTQWLAVNPSEKIRVFHTVIIPGINDMDIHKIAHFLRDIDPNLPYHLVGFRPHFLLYYHQGPSNNLMQNLMEKCRNLSLKNVGYSGYNPDETLIDEYSFKKNLRMIITI